MAHKDKATDYTEQYHTGFTGTGEYTDASATVPTTMRGVSAVLSTGDTGFFCAQGEDGSGNATQGREVFLGTKTATGLARTTILLSTNGNAAVNWSTAARVRVSLTVPSDKAWLLDNVGATLIPVATAEPGTPAASNLYVYAKEIAPGFVVVKTKRPDGQDTPLQDSIAFNRMAKVIGSGASLVSSLVGAATSTGSTFAAVTPSSGSAKSQLPRASVTSGATAGNVCPIAYAAGILPMLRGNVLGEGGFRFTLRFALQTGNAANRGFWGISDAVAVATNIDPLASTTNGKIGIGFNANTGNWQLINNVAASAPTVLDLGANFPYDTTSLMELVLTCRPHNGSAGNITYRIRRYTTNSDAPAFETTGTLSTNIPAATTILQPWMWMTNNATASAVVWHLNEYTVESDW